MGEPSPFELTGINGTTGRYLPAPTSLDAVYDAVAAKSAIGRMLTDQHYANLRGREERARVEAFGVAAGVRPKDLASTGWGAVFHRDAPAELFSALRPLLDLRKTQAGKVREAYYFEFARDTGYQPGDDKVAFLKRLGRAAGQPADPRRGVPYYLLLVGSPRDIPWAFQYDLDVEYAVGRLHFEADDGTPDYDAYYRYAKSVELAETRPPSFPRTVTFFAPNHDPATAFSATKLVAPLTADLAEWETDTAGGWAFDSILGPKAKKDRLADLVGGAKTPAVLFTAGHGIGFENGDARQLRHQGGLVCQDIGKFEGNGAVSEKAYFSADDVPAAARLNGLISFHFACYGAGTPAVDDYPDTERKVFRDQPIAPHPFAARLPQKLLGHPNGGALGYVGHVDRAWSCSFLLTRSQEQIDVFGSFLKDLLDGMPLGGALEYFNDRYAAMAAVLTSQLQRVRAGKTPDAAFKGAVAATWLEHNDARNYVIFGDPAVRVRVADAGAALPTRPDLAAEVIRPTGSPPAGGPVSFDATAPPETPPMSPPATPFDPDQIAAAEQRYDALIGPADFSFTTIGTRDLLQRNDRGRLVRRFRKLGLTADRAAAAADAVHGDDDGPVDFATDLPAAARKDIGLERIFGKNELMKARYLELGLTASRPVGRVNIRGRQKGYGTGFLVSPSLLLTNNHVLKSTEAAAASFVEFNYQDGLDGTPLPVLKVSLDPTTFFITDRTLDFTLVAVLTNGLAKTRTAALGYLPLTGGDDAYVIGENVTIVQHPNGEPKQIALRNNQVIGESGESFLHYQTDTMPGSSGSPVFNDEFELVALHHSGVPERDPKTRQILSTDGRPWQPGMGEDRVKWVANEGVLVPAILRFLDAQKLAGRAAALFAELKSASVGGPKTVEVESAQTRSVAVGAETPARGTTVTVPLRLTIAVELGDPGAGPTVVAAVPAKQSHPLPTVTGGPEKAAALTELEAFSTRPYFDATKDAAAQTVYYAGLSPGSDPVQAFKKLSARLAETHATQLGYKPASYLYPWVDLQPNGRVRSIYSGREYNAASLIEEDFAVEAERAARLQELLASEAAAAPDVLAAELDLLEAQLLYNCEHVVPQSWFAKKPPMKGDLHHLFACETGCNSFRGNTPYFDFPDFDEAVRDDCGKKDGNRFEPGAGKGEVARATLYFLLRYPGQINATPAEYTSDRLPILLAWHEKFPPTSHEKHRNQAVFEKQGNRNPLIDFPEWAGKIAFTAGLG